MVSQHSTPETSVSLTGSRPGERFSVSFRRDGMRSVVAVAGELDMATAPHLEDVLRGLCSPIDGDLEIDAAEISFCDCHGLAVLLRAAQRRRTRGRRLTVIHPSASLRRLIELAGVAERLRVTDEPFPIDGSGAP